jgi:hypothetical protein
MRNACGNGRCGTPNNRTQRPATIDFILNNLPNQWGQQDEEQGDGFGNFQSKVYLHTWYIYISERVVQEKIAVFYQISQDSGLFRKNGDLDRL